MHKLLFLEPGSVWALYKTTQDWQSLVQASGIEEEEERQQKEGRASEMQIAERWRPYMKTNFSFRSNKKFNPSADRLRGFTMRRIFTLYCIDV